MQEIKKEDVIFLSENGKIFLSKEACLKEESNDAYSYQQNIYNQMLKIESSK